MTRRLQIGFVFIILNMGFGYLLYPGLVFSLTNAGHWGAVLSHGLVYLILIIIYKKGLNYFPKQDVVDIFLQMGRWLFFIFMFPFVINLTVLVALGLRTHVEDMISIFLIRTPPWPVLVLFFLISTYTAIKGLDAILRASVFIFLT